MEIEIIEIGIGSVWYEERGMFEGKRMRIDSDGMFRFSAVDDKFKFEGNEYSNRVGFSLLNDVEFKEL